MNKITKFFKSKWYGLILGLYTMLGLVLSYMYPRTSDPVLHEILVEWYFWIFAGLIIVGLINGIRNHIILNRNYESNRKQKNG